LVTVPNGSLERYRPPQRDPAAPDNPASGIPRRRAGYLLGGLLGVPLLIAGGLWLAGGGGPARSLTAASAPATDPASAAPVSAAAAAVSSPPVIDFTQPALGAPSPFHVSLARVPARHPRPRSAVQATPSSSPARSAGPAATVTATATAAGSAGTGSGSPATEAGSPAGQVLALINQARSAAGLAPLTVTAGLQDSAQAHDLRMADGCGLTHQCPGEPAIGDRETAAGVTWTAAGENIGEGGPVSDTTAAMAAMAVNLTQDMLNEQPPDDGHRLNILSTTFTHIGIAVYRDSSGTVWLTQDFSH
jgi:uncharacterized protein YkwD